MTSNRSDFVAPILLAIFAYLASMLTRAFQRSIEQTSVVRSAHRAKSLNHTIVDNFIQDKDTLERLQDKKAWEECDGKGWRWWDGKTEPENLWEELAQKIWSPRPEFQTASK